MTVKTSTCLLFLYIIQLSCLKAEKACYEGPPDIITKMTWPDMDKDCLQQVKAHIKRELEASLTYIAMGAHFLNSASYRPSVATFYLKYAYEERQHAKTLMDYILMRGYSISKEDIPTMEPLATSWESVLDALNTTLSIETGIRNYLKTIIFTCSGGNHPEVTSASADYLSRAILDERQQDIRELSDLLVKLGQMKKSSDSATFAEMEFDRSLLVEC